LQEIDDNLLKVVRGSSGRNPAGVEAEIRELEKELKIPGKFHPRAEIKHIILTLHSRL